MKDLRSEEPGERSGARDPATLALLRQMRARKTRRRRLHLLAAGTLLVFLAAVLAASFTLANSDGTAQAPGTSTTAGGGSSLTTTSTSAVSNPPTTTRAVWSTTTSPEPSNTTTSAPGPSTTERPAQHGSGEVVVIDPGHQARGNYDLEPIGPGSSDKKAKVSSGTAGVVTGTPESELVLAIALKLRDALKAEGYNVVMTRTTQDIDLSNIERTKMANEAGADLYIRVHADGADNQSAHGIHVLYPASIEGWTDDIAGVSRRAAGIAQEELIAATGAKDLGIDARSDMTGFNWSDVPVIIPELGFMTNPDEDRLLNSASYQDKIVSALVSATRRFFSGA